MPCFFFTSGMRVSQIDTQAEHGEAVDDETTDHLQLYHAPDLAALIVRRCTAAKTAHRIRTKALVSGAVSNAIHNRTSAGEPLARKTLLRDLYRETGLPKNMLREEISAQFGSNPKKTDYACMQ